MRKSLFIISITSCVFIFTACIQESQGSLYVDDQSLNQQLSSENEGSGLSVYSLTDASLSENRGAFSLNTVSFPNDFPPDHELDGFLAAKTKENINGTSPLHVDGENVYFRTRIDDSLGYFKFNRGTHEILPILNTLPLPDYGSLSRAFIRDALYTTYVDDGQLHHIALNFNQKEIETLAVFSPEMTDKISRIYTYPVNNEEYAELWFEMKTPRIFHIELFRKDGTKKELFTKQEETGKEFFYYLVNDNRIYEYREESATCQVNVNIYDLNGTLMSSVFLPELSELLTQRTEDDNYLTAVDAFGDFFAVNVFTFPHNNCYIYNLKEKYIVKIEDGVRVIPAVCSDNAMESYVFQLERATENYEIYYDLYCMDRNGSIFAIAHDVKGDAVATDGKTVIYLKNGIVYERSLQEIMRFGT